ncbi:UDP-galactopyranose mutase precursor [Rubripirellula amarantea]|uniref:UDP-galactopyranose mutase n=1 Tax=Rubripirellula amarantea TaxID=2527999 RepID=A0A5C5WR01_9BACT|nr:FAD-dependent oxidoreductase [Rubripirellula amarantea]TWT53324.1 UDP-galactopyranose mutase precursor [Rubripirellula amarantea]
MRVAIIGAGPAGMTAALQLCRGGADVTVYEASQHIGGMSRSLDLWGHRVDMGPHRFFSTDARVNGLWLDVVGRDYAMVNRLTRIYYQDKFFHYPLRPFDTLRNIGLSKAFACTLSYVKERILRGQSPHENESFESWCVRRFGRKLHETFFKSYSEKLWGIPCDELSADFAAQRISSFSLPEAILSAISNRRAAQHKTLVDSFAYPFGGTGAVYDKMADQVRHLGGTIALNTPVRRVVHEGYKVTGLELAGHENNCTTDESFDHVVSTMPLTSLVRGMQDAPSDVVDAAAQLRFRNTLLVFLNIDSSELFDDQWLYIHDPKVQVGRVTNFRNWVPDLYQDQSTSVIACEYWCDHNDAIWSTNDDELIERATNELRSTRLLNSERVLAGHVERLPRCYPVYRRGYRKHVDRISDHLRQYSGLLPIGRYGSFKYNNQDHSILMGILAAENILNDARHDLWNVNADFTQYHERAVIAAEGLISQPQVSSHAMAIA